MELTQEQKRAIAIARARRRRTEERTLWRSVLRPTGISTRGLLEGAVQGVGALGALPLDAARNLGVAVDRNVLGGESEYGMPFMEGVNRTATGTADLLGLPEAESQLEKFMAATGAGVGAVLPGVGAGRLASKAGSELARRVGTEIARAPASQVASGAAAGAGTEAARQADLGPAAQIGAGLAAGTATSLGVAGARTAASTLDPFFSSSRQRMVGQALRDIAKDPDQAARTAASAPEYVRGSRPTLGGASDDIGLLTAEHSLRSKDSTAFGDRRIVNNLQRHELANKIAPTGEVLDARKSQLSEWADAKTAKLFPDNRRRAVSTNSLDKLFDMLKGSRLSDSAEGRTALQVAKSELNILKEKYEGSAIPVDALYEMRKNLAAFFKNKDFVDPGNRRHNIAKTYKQTKPVLDTLDSLIESKAPGYRSYLSEFARRKTRIDQHQLLRELFDDATSKGSEVGGAREMNQARLNAFLKNYKKRGDAARLTPTQLRVVERIAEDIGREQKNMTRMVSGPKSDTAQNLMQNMSIAGIMAKAIGGPAAGLPGAKKLIDIVYSVPEDRMNELLVQAILDPKLGVNLMRKADPENITGVANELQRLARAIMASGEGAIGATDF